jgi:hypothetical protein
VKTLVAAAAAPQDSLAPVRAELRHALGAATIAALHRQSPAMNALSLISAQPQVPTWT